MEKMRTSGNSWQASLSRLLQQPGADRAGRPRLAVVGIGNDQRGDDMAGNLVARCLATRAVSLAQRHILVVEAGHAPENVTGILRRFHPASVLLVDAAEMGEQPGTVRWIEMQEISGMTASTHSMPLSMVAEYLTLELGCQVAVLGIQPGSNEYGVSVGEPVSEAVGEIVAQFLA